MPTTVYILPDGTEQNGKRPGFVAGKGSFGANWIIKQDQATLDDWGITTRIDPDPVETPQEKIVRLIIHLDITRRDKEQGGTLANVGNTFIPLTTTREVQGQYEAAWNNYSRGDRQMNVNTNIIDAIGTPHQVDGNTMFALQQTVVAHVGACYDAYRDIHGRILTGTANTEAHITNAPEWPTTL